MGREKLAKVLVLTALTVAITIGAMSTMPQRGERVNSSLVYQRLYKDRLDLGTDRLERGLEIKRLVDIEQFARQEQQERFEKSEAIRVQAEKEAKAEEERLAKVAREKSNAQAKTKPVTCNKPTASRGGSVGKQVIFELTFYTSLPEENGGHENLANGEHITAHTNVVASNYYKIETEIYLEGYGSKIVKDRGGSAFNNYNRLDVLIQRNSGESNSAYKKRVNNMGRPSVVGYVR